MGVNAIGCAQKVVQGPTRDTGGWEVPLGSATRAPSANERAPVEPVLRWRAGVKRGAAGPPAVGDRMVAVSALDRSISVFAWETGETIWRHTLGSPSVGAPLVIGDRVYVASAGANGRVYALALTNGKDRWHQEVGPVVAPIAATPGRVFVGTQAGIVTALGAGQGSHAWSRRLPGPLRLGPVLVGDVLLVATEDTLYLLDQTDGSVRHRAPSPGTVIAPPAWTGDTLVITSPDGVVAGILKGDLSTAWEIRTDDPIFGMPAIARDTVFAITLGGALWRIPLADPGGYQTQPLGVTVRAAPAPTADGVLIGTTAGEVLFAGDDGTVTPRARVDGPIEQPPVVTRGVLLVIDGKGRVYTWR